MSRISISAKHARAIISDVPHPLLDEALAAIRAQLAPRPRSSAAKKTERKRRDKKAETSAIREQVAARANGACEQCGWAFRPFNPGELDHFRGRGKVLQSVENTWLLCRDCHREKTLNAPDAAAWLERFAAHCQRHGYAVEWVLARNRLHFPRSSEARCGMRGLVVDLFAGGGGASTGIEAALGRDVDIAINHSAIALAVHEANHPRTKHLTANIWEVDPRIATGGRRVDVLWASPDCTHHSVAKGGKPRDNKLRSLAWVVVDWARYTRPNVIFLENVCEFRSWGPLYEVGHRLPDGRILKENDKEVGTPIKARAGETFELWKGELGLLGYTVEHRVLDASHYGAPTRRRRLFLVARRDGEPIVWPEPTHGPGREPFHTAAECIDWSIPCPSIFLTKKQGRKLGVKRPLAKKTMWRIAQGLKKYVLNNPRPFIVKVNHGGMEDRSESIDKPLSTVTASRRGHAVVAPVLQQSGYGERKGQSARVLNLHEPLGTVVAGGPKHALVAAFLAKHFGGNTTPGIPLDGPVSTITTQDHHALVAAHITKFQQNSIGQDPRNPLDTVMAGATRFAEVRAFLSVFYGSEAAGAGLDEPMRTVTTKDRFGLVIIKGTVYEIVDIGMRMLEPHELLRAQFGRFAHAYDLSAAVTKTAKVRLIGNSVCPEAAEAVVRANMPRQRMRRAA